MKLAVLTGKPQQTALLDMLSVAGLTGQFWVDGIRSKVAGISFWNYVFDGTDYSYLPNFYTGYPVTVGDFLAAGRVGNKTGMFNLNELEQKFFICQS